VGKVTKILAVNSGSSSLKFKLFEMPSEAVIIEGDFERIGNKEARMRLKVRGIEKSDRFPIYTHVEAVELLIRALIDEKAIESYSEISGVGHRISHGGVYYKDAVLVNETVKSRILELGALSPLHNPVNLMGIEAFEKVLKDVKQVAIFDTSFHHTIPKENYIYALPYRYFEDYGIRRYGFHGPSHQYVSEEAIKIYPQAQKMITCHLGSGSSISAILNGQSIDSSMGFTPLAGLVMGTRTGDIDPQIIPFIQEKEGLTPREIKDLINKESGLLGISGFSNDLRDLENAAQNGNERAQLAIDVFVHQIVHYIGAYAAMLNGVGALVFTAGIGERSSLVRTKVCNALTYLGLAIDEAENKMNARVINTAQSKVKVFVIPTNEEVIIARDVVRVANI
jgi:acetate kinase